MKHFGIMIRDEAQITEVWEKVTQKYGLVIEPDSTCDFRDPWGNRMQVVDLHDESMIWLLSYRKIQDLEISFDAVPGGQASAEAK